MGLSPPFCNFYFRAQNPLVWVFEAHFQLSYFLLLFSFVRFDFMM